MFRFNFGRKMRRVARHQYRHGKITRDEYRKIVDGSRDSDVVKRWQSTVEKSVPGAPWLQKGAFNWRDIFTQIWEWFLENWPTILKLCLTLLVFVQEPPQSDESNEESDSQLVEDEEVG